MLEEVIKKYYFSQEVVKVDFYGNGHINKTYIIITKTEKYIIQKINTNVFKNPKHVMQNIEKITEYIKKKIEMTENKVLELIPNKKNRLLTKHNNEFYRCYKFIEGARTYDVIENEKMFYEVGKAIGQFQKHLNDFPINDLHITIPKFHDTIFRFRSFLEAVNSDNYNRCKDCYKEIEFLWKNKEIMGKIVENENIPIRVAHNDTKLNNIMIDEKTYEAVCVIDLDTVMPGSALYDFGDAIRIGANTTKEDELNLKLVKLDLQLFESFSRGFLKEVGDLLFEEEKKLLVDSCIIITMECGMRFLTDYLMNDVYFKIDYETHNLDRAKNQLAFANELVKHKKNMERIIKKILNELNIKKKEK